MTVEWIWFGVTAFFMITGLVVFAAAVLGANKFDYALNRVHAAGVGDTLGVLCIAIGLIVSSGSVLEALKIVLLLFFLWFSSPTSTHLLGQVEVSTNQRMWRKLKKSNAALETDDTGKEDEK